MNCAPPTRIASARPEQPPPNLYVCPFTIIEDTQEGAPWTFQGIVIEKQLWLPQRKRQHLKTADYTIEGMEDLLCIERKSGSDLVGSITGGRRRFLAEHERMLEIVRGGGFACVIIEDSFSAIHNQLIVDWEAGRDLSPETLIGHVASWPAKYRTPWFFAGDRRRAELLAFRVMVKQWDERGGKKEKP